MSEVQRNRDLLRKYQDKQDRNKGEELLRVLPQGPGSGLDADTVDKMHAEQIIEEALARIGMPSRWKGPTIGGGGGGMQKHGDEFHDVLYALADKSRPSPWVAETDVPVLSDAKYPNAFLLDGSRKMGGNFDPDTDNAYDIGASASWKDGYFAGYLWAEMFETYEVAGDLIPELDDVYVLGDPLLRWKDLYLAGDLDIGGDFTAHSVDVSGAVYTNELSPSSGTNISTKTGITLTLSILSSIGNVEPLDLFFHEGLYMRLYRGTTLLFQAGGNYKNKCNFVKDAEFTTQIRRAADCGHATTSGGGTATATFSSGEAGDYMGNQKPIVKLTPEYAGDQVFAQIFSWTMDGSNYKGCTIYVFNDGGKGVDGVIVHWEAIRRAAF